MPTDEAEIEELRFELAVLEWSLDQWLQGAMTHIEGGDRITDKLVSQWRRRIEELKQLLAGLDEVSPPSSEQPEN
jgi:hypothetical protein